MIQVKQFVIMSTDLISLPAFPSLGRFSMLESYLKDNGYSFVECEGKYKGTTERSVMILINSNEQLEDIKSLAFNVFNQENILYRDSNGLFSLEYPDKSVILGRKLRELSDKECELRDNYTKILSTGVCFVVD